MVRLETSTAMSMTQGEAATAVQLPMSAKGRKISTAKGGSVTFLDSAGVWSRVALVAVPRVLCTTVLGISTNLTTWSAHPSVQAGRILQPHQQLKFIEF